MKQILRHPKATRQPIGVRLRLGAVFTTAAAIALGLLLLERNGDVASLGRAHTPTVSTGFAKSVSKAGGSEYLSYSTFVSDDLVQMVQHTRGGKVLTFASGERDPAELFPTETVSGDFSTSYRIKAVARAGVSHTIYVGASGFRVGRGE